MSETATVTATTNGTVQPVAQTATIETAAVTPAIDNQTIQPTAQATPAVPVTPAAQVTEAPAPVETPPAAEQPTPAEKSAEPVNVDDLRKQIRAEIEKEFRASEYENARRDEVARWQAVLKSCDGDYQFAARCFEQGMDMAKAKSARADHVLLMAQQRIPVGVSAGAVANAQAQQAAGDHWKQYAAKWDGLGKH